MDLLWLWNSVLNILIQLKPTSKKEIVRWTAFSLLFIIIGYSIYYLKTENPLSEENIKKQLVQTEKLKRECKKMATANKIDGIHVFLIHNGKVTANRLHYLRYSYIDGYDNIWNMSFMLNQSEHDKPLYPYSSIMLEIIEKHYMIVEDIDITEDLLIKNFGVTLNKKSLIFFPLKEEDKLYGFVVMGYKNTTKITDSTVNQLYNSSLLINDVIIKFK